MSAESTWDEMKGRAKEAAGDLTGDEDLKREGKVDRITSDVKETAEKVVDKVRDGVDAVADAVKKRLGGD